MFRKDRRGPYRPYMIPGSKIEGRPRSTERSDKVRQEQRDSAMMERLSFQNSEGIDDLTRPAFLRGQSITSLISPSASSSDSTNFEHLDDRSETQSTSSLTQDSRASGTKDTTSSEDCHGNGSSQQSAFVHCYEETSNPCTSSSSQCFDSSHTPLRNKPISTDKFQQSSSRNLPSFENFIFNNENLSRQPVLPQPIFEESTSPHKQSCDGFDGSPPSRSESISGDEFQQSSSKNEKTRSDLNREKIFLKYELYADTTELSGVTKYEALVMLLHMCLKFTVEEHLLEAMLNYSSIILGQDLVPTLHLFQVLFGTDNYKKHYYCPKCMAYEGEKEVKPGDLCKICQLEYTTESPNKYFVTLDMEKQIKDIIERNQHAIEAYKQECSTTEDNVIRDCCDGLLYKSLKSTTDADYTMLLNTDGVAVFKSRNKSLWPIQCVINELPPNIRFKFHNRVVGGFWFDDPDPRMDLFMLPFVKRCQIFADSGVEWVDESGKTHISKIYLLNATFDGTAKPKVTNTHQFNGEYGCLYCFEKGTRISHSNRYLVTNEPLVLRNDTTMREHARLAEQSGSVVAGVKGFSVLSAVPSFDLVNGVTIDYLHAWLIGTVEDWLNLLCSSTSSTEAYYIGLKVPEIDERIKGIKLPSKITKSPRPVVERGYWKANDYRPFILIYGVPVLIDILPNPYLQNLSRLSSILYVLLKESITIEEIDQNDQDIEDFQWEFQTLYPIEEMKSNLHLMRHSGQCVKHNGPSWVYCQFCFESGNGVFRDLLNGTVGVLSQIADKFCMVKNLDYYLDFVVSKKVKDFCNGFYNPNLRKHSKKCGDATLLGFLTPFQLNTEERELLNKEVAEIPQFIFKCETMILKGFKFHPSTYSRAKKIFDGCAKLENGKSVVINRILWLGEEVVILLVREVKISSKSNKILPSHIKECFVPKKLEIARPSDIVTQRILFNVGQKSYVTDYPNRYEGD